LRCEDDRDSWHSISAMRRVGEVGVLVLGGSRDRIRAMRTARGPRSTRGIRVTSH
jgi:hypothetical protein